MVAYPDFVALCASNDSEQRGQAAHLAALAYIGHTGPLDERAALYAALIGFLDDPSARVRGALAYGMLHAKDAPRPILLALLHDSPIIARAIAQYSPALIDADLIGLIDDADPQMLLALAARDKLSRRLAEALAACSDSAVLLRLVGRADAPLSDATLTQLARTDAMSDAKLRGALLRRADLPADARLHLVEAVAAALRNTRLVKGAILPRKLNRLLRDATDTALSGIGEREAYAGRAPYAAGLVGAERVSTRIMLHSVVHGHVLFFADCLAEISEMPRAKVFGLLASGGRAALNALFGRCGMSAPVRNLLARLVCHARATDVSDDAAARHFVVNAMTEELILEHEGVIPAELEEAFAYLSEQNVLLARKAARGVMTAFADADEARPMSLPAPSRLALPAA